MVFGERRGAGEDFGIRVGQEADSISLGKERHNLIDVRTKNFCESLFGTGRNRVCGTQAKQNRGESYEKKEPANK